MIQLLIILWPASGLCGGEPVEREGLATQGASAEDEDKHDLQIVQDLVEDHPGPGIRGSVLWGPAWVHPGPSTFVSRALNTQNAMVFWDSSRTRRQSHFAVHAAHRPVPLSRHLVPRHRR
jgi:hypothetical protein